MAGRGLLAGGQTEAAPARANSEPWRDAGDVSTMRSSRDRFFLLPAPGRVVTIGVKPAEVATVLVPLVTVVVELSVEVMVLVDVSAVTVSVSVVTTVEVIVSSGTNQPCTEEPTRSTHPAQ